MQVMFKQEGIFCITGGLGGQGGSTHGGGGSDGQSGNIRQGLGGSLVGAIISESRVTGGNVKGVSGGFVVVVACVTFRRIHFSIGILTGPIIIPRGQRSQ